MKNTFTILKRTLLQASGALFTLLAAGGLGSSASAQTYCTPTHYYGCGYSSTQYRYAAIEEVTFETNGNVVYDKAADGCNDIAGGINTGHHSVINSAPGFQLSYGSSFSVWVNGQTYASNAEMWLAVWIDLNRDGDFDDNGEFLGGNKAPCVVNRTLSSTNYPAQKEFKFNIPCGA